MRIACIICGKDFKTRHDLERHNVVHTGTRSFTYKYCNKSFTQAGTLGRHEKHDSGEKHFSCQHWNKTFLEAGQLKHHMRVHTKQKSEFVCLFCEQYFKTSQILKIHSVVHTGKRLFSFKQCNKSFTQEGSLGRQKKVSFWGKTIFLSALKQNFCGRTPIEVSH